MFVNRKEWNPSKYSVICAKHFDPKYIKEGKKSKLIWELQPVLTIHDNPDMCVVPPLPRKAPKVRNVFNDEWDEFKANDIINDFQSLSPDISPKDFTFLKEETFCFDVPNFNRREHKTRQFQTGQNWKLSV